MHMMAGGVEAMWFWAPALTRPECKEATPGPLHKLVADMPSWQMGTHRAMPVWAEVMCESIPGSRAEEVYLHSTGWK